MTTSYYIHGKYFTYRDLRLLKLAVQLTGLLEGWTKIQNNDMKRISFIVLFDSRLDQSLKVFFFFILILLCVFFRSLKYN